MSNTSSSDYPRLAVRTLTITIATGNTDCQQALCGAVRQHMNASDEVYWTCEYAPRKAEYLVQSAINAKKCTEDNFNVTWPDDGTTLRFAEEQFPTVCTFVDQNCAQRVCDTHLQRSRINVTEDGKSWSCYSDSAIAQAAFEAKYWFTTTDSTWPCKDAKPDCKDLEGRTNPDALPAGAQVSAATKASRSLLALAVSAACLGVLAACGATVI